MLLNRRSAYGVNYGNDYNNFPNFLGTLRARLRCYFYLETGQTTKEHALQQSSQPDTTIERRFFHATGIVMVLGTIVSGAIMLWLATNTQTSLPPANFAVYGRGEVQVSEGAPLEASENVQATTVVFLEGATPKLEAPFELPNLH